jgi:hypothetical protein
METLVIGLHNCLGAMQLGHPWCHDISNCDTQQSGATSRRFFCFYAGNFTLKHRKPSNMAFLKGDAIPIEKFLSLQIAIASASDKCVLFSSLCKHHTTRCQFHQHFMSSFCAQILLSKKYKSTL